MSLKYFFKIKNNMSLTETTTKKKAIPKKLKDLFVCDNLNNKCVCQVENGSSICGEKITKTGNTSARTNHISKKHPFVILSKENQLNQAVGNTPEVKESFFGYDVNSSRNKILQNAVAEFIVMDNQPISLIDNKAFNKLLFVFDPRYRKSCRQTLTKDTIPDMKKKTIEKIKKELDKAEYVSITSDCWTSVSNNAFMSVTCHWVNECFELKNCLLALKYCPVSHTGFNLSNEIKACLDEWNLTKKVIYF